MELVISDERDQIRAALSSLLIDQSQDGGELLDEAALQREIDEDFRNQPPLSETIIDERKSGR